jgi:hypothetical protein
MGTFVSLSKSATTSALDWSELALLVFGIILVAGLVGEYRTLEPHSQRMKFFEMLVIIGVAGELLGDGGIFLFSTHLQTISEIEVARLGKDAGEARKAAGEAQERAAKAELKTEQEKLARLRLEQHIAPRRITPTQRSFLIKCLGHHDRERMYLMVQGGGDPEIEDFGKQIEAVLGESGFKDVIFNSCNPPCSIGNVSFTLSAGKDRMATANLLASCFKKAGMPFIAIKKELAYPPTELDILVGYKQH